MKAVNVTAPGGGPCSGPRKSRPNYRRRDGRGAGKKSSAAAGAASSSNTKGPPKTRDPFWHESLNDSVRGMLEEKGIRLGITRRKPLALDLYIQLMVLWQAFDKALRCHQHEIDAHLLRR